MTDAPSAASLVLERRIAAPAAMVFAMLIDAVELKQWLGPRGFVVTELEADVRPGGRFRFRMRKDGRDYGSEGVYREVVRDERIAWTWRWVEAPPGEPLDTSETLVTIELRTEDAFTVLTLTHAQLPDQSSADAHAIGWNDGLDELVARIEAKRTKETPT